MQTAESIQKATEALINELRQTMGETEGRNKARAYLGYQFENLTAIQRDAEVAALSVVGVLACEVPGSLSVVEEQEGVFAISKGNHKLAIWDGREDVKNPKRTVLAATLTLTELGSALYEMDCEHHGEEAQKVVNGYLGVR